MAGKRALFVLGILALLVAACAPAATPTPTAAVGKSGPTATPLPGVAPTPTAAPTATAVPAPAQATAKPVKLSMMVSYEPTGTQLTPIAASGAGEPIVLNVMEPLVDYTKDGVIPRLATKWEQRDPTTWRFYLRKGVKFHNGAELTARDLAEHVKWNWEEKNLSTAYANVPAKEAVPVDDYTFDLVFEAPQPLLFLGLRSYLLTPVAVSRENRSLAETSPVGTGPYRWVEWNRGRHIKLTRFEGYWGPKPQIDDVQIIFRGEEAVRLAALRVGEVSWVSGLSPESAARAPKVVSMASPETVYLRFDEYIQKELGGESILADKRLRMAVDYAIDRQALVKLYGGLATPSLGQWASPGDFGYNPDLKGRPYDLEKARALVREAGAVGKTVTYAGSNDRFAKDREVHEAIAYMIQQTGLNVKLMLMPKVELTKYREVKGANRAFNADIVALNTDAFLEVETRFGYFTAGHKYFSSLDTESLRLYKEVQAETDYAKRGKKLGEAWAYLYEQALYVPVFKLQWIWGLAKNLEWNIGIAGLPVVADMSFTH